MQNWKNLIVVAGAVIVALVAYDVLIGPALAGLLTTGTKTNPVIPPKPKM